MRPHKMATGSCAVPNLSGAPIAFLSRGWSGISARRRRSNILPPQPERTPNTQRLLLCPSVIPSLLLETVTLSQLSA